MLARRFPIVFTDLDGTLLDHHTYTFDAASEALEALKAHSIPLILNTSKTADETIALSSELGICHPIIVENGGAIIFPSGYSAKINIRQDSNWDDEPTILTLGITRDAILSIMSQANDHLAISDCYQSFSAMGNTEIMRTTGLALEDAQQANNRQYSEPLLWQGEQSKLVEFSLYLEEKGCQIIKGGRFHHVIGKNDKRTAMERLVRMYRNGAESNLDPIVIALGDGANDLTMLKGADIAVIVKNDTQPAFDLEHPDLYRTKQIGPAGWQEAMVNLLARF